MPRVEGPSLLGRLFALPRVYNRVVQVGVDTVLLIFSFVAAMVLRLETLTFVTDLRLWAVMALVLPVTILAFIGFGFYRAIIRYMTHRAFLSISKGILVSAVSLLFASMLIGVSIPASMPLLYFLLAFGTVGGVRFMARALFHRNQSRTKVRVIIYGAGQTGRQVSHSLFQGPDYVPVAFIDDAPELESAQVSGLKVFPPSKLKSLIDDYSVKVVLLAIPSATRARRAEILRSLDHLPVHVQTVPSFEDHINGRSPPDAIRQIAIDDLLGRDPVPPDPVLLQRNIAGKSVLVTGAGGSVGAELCITLLRQAPSELVLVESSEIALFNVMDRLKAVQALRETSVSVRAVLANVQDQARMTRVIRQYKVETLFHAAAYKHVPLVEDNPTEGLRNNVFGTLATARAAIDGGVRHFTLISTDKAVRPSSIMGASKRLAEMVCLALAEALGPTHFSVVRFGNVLGSSGSVIPMFKAQIANGGPVEVTHPQMTRFFMTMAEAAELVIQAGALGDSRAEVFLLDMGEPVRILDLAKQMIRLSGLTPVVLGDVGAGAQALGKDELGIVFSGRRRGEKLIEELLIDPNASPTSHTRIFAAAESGHDWAVLSRILDQIDTACKAGDTQALIRCLAETGIGYGPDKSGTGAVITRLNWRAARQDKVPEALRTAGE